MGVTIHFEGRLRDQTGMRNVLQLAKAFASKHNWATEEISELNVTLGRVDGNEKAYDYHGPVTGLILHPDNDCDPIRLEFDNDLYVQEWTKTQFAGAEMHITIVEFLRNIERYFETFKVNDEAEYWETSDVELLKKYLADCDRFIAEYRQEHPNVEVKVKTPTGRIVDMITYD